MKPLSQRECVTLKTLLERAIFNCQFNLELDDGMESGIIDADSRWTVTEGLVDYGDDEYRREGGLLDGAVPEVNVLVTPETIERLSDAIL